ncbi:MAG: hypothetical protein ACREV7_09890 [Steroidobacteraceae bacterium]
MARGYSGARGRFGGRSYGGYGTTGDYGYGASGHDDPLTAGAGPSRHPIAPRSIHRSAEELYENLCEALVHRDDLDSSEIAVAATRTTGLRSGGRVV